MDRFCMVAASAIVVGAPVSMILSDNSGEVSRFSVDLDGNVKIQGLTESFTQSQLFRVSGDGRAVDK
jgi:hypothetical protein